MKWFKHISDSLDDPFIFDLIDQFGGDGYLVFFGVLEIYSQEFKPELNWKLNITRAYLKQKLHKRQDTLPIKILEHIKNSGKWEVSLNGSQLTIFIPKFKEIIDEWTKKKLRSDSVVPPKILPPEEEVEEEKETYSENSNEFSLSKFLFNEIRKRKTDYKKPNLQEWAKHIDYMIRIDLRSPEKIREIIEWCQQDDFWKDNILSTKKLRKQFDQLELKSQKPKQTSTIGTCPKCKRPNIELLENGQCRDCR